MKSRIKIINRINVFLLFLLSGTALAQASAYLPPIYYLLLQESRLEKVLRAYSNPGSEHIFIAAHRGGKENDEQDAAPGNSIANIDNAFSIGFDLYESDIEILGDGTLVVFHDNVFDHLSNTSETDDALDNADLAYAKSLFLTYDNGVVSNQRIPTLEEFLNAARDKIMLKFDLKSGTFGTSTLKNIFDTVVSTDTVDQVLIRGGSNLLIVADSNGYDTRMIMRRYDSAPSVMDINDLVSDYNVRAISIPSGADSAVITAANAHGLVVEIHELTDITNQEREDAIAAGYRQFHSFKPSLLLDYLKTNGHREF